MHTYMFMEKITEGVGFEDKQNLSGKYELQDSFKTVSIFGKKNISKSRQMQKFKNSTVSPIS